MDNSAIKLRVVPLTLKQANDAVAAMHRHHKPVQGHRFSIGVEADGKLLGAAIVGRPAGRKNPQYSWAEVTRLVSNGQQNVCSKLYAACARICQEMRFERIQTFILESETGISLKASGWQFDCWSEGGNWNVPSRGGRREDQPQERKARWFRSLA